MPNVRRKPEFNADPDPDPAFLLFADPDPELLSEFK
jgi:hypothetical protein